MTVRNEIAPLRLISKLRNNRMIRAREYLGMSGPQISEAIGVSYGSWVSLESLKDSPLRPNGDWRRIALQISDWLKVMPEDLWPEEALAVEHSKMEIELSASDARLLMDSTQQVALPEYRTEIEADGLEDALKTLSPREEMILRMRFGLNGEEHNGFAGQTIDDLATRFEVSRERIRQIEMKALRKLRHPSRTKMITITDEGRTTDRAISRCRMCGLPLTRKRAKDPYRCACGLTVSP